MTKDIQPNCSNCGKPKCEQEEWEKKKSEETGTHFCHSTSTTDPCHGDCQQPQEEIRKIVGGWFMIHKRKLGWFCSQREDEIVEAIRQLLSDTEKRTRINQTERVLEIASEHIYKYQQKMFDDNCPMEWRFAFRVFKDKLGEKIQSELTRLKKPE